MKETTRVSHNLPSDLPVIKVAARNDIPSMVEECLTELDQTEGTFVERIGLDQIASSSREENLAFVLMIISQSDPLGWVNDLDESTWVVCIFNPHQVAPIRRPNTTLIPINGIADSQELCNLLQCMSQGDFVPWELVVYGGQQSHQDYGKGLLDQLTNLAAGICQKRPENIDKEQALMHMSEVLTKLLLGCWRYRLFKYQGDALSLKGIRAFFIACFVNGFKDYLDQFFGKYRTPAAFQQRPHNIMYQRLTGTHSVLSKQMQTLSHDPAMSIHQTLKSVGSSLKLSKPYVEALLLLVRILKLQESHWPQGFESVDGYKKHYQLTSKAYAVLFQLKYFKPNSDVSAIHQVSQQLTLSKSIVAELLIEVDLWTSRSKAKTPFHHALNIETLPDIASIDDINNLDEEERESLLQGLKRWTCKLHRLNRQHLAMDKHQQLVKQMQGEELLVLKSLSESMTNEVQQQKNGLRCKLDHFLETGSGIKGILTAKERRAAAKAINQDEDTFNKAFFSSLQKLRELALNVLASGGER